MKPYYDEGGITLFGGDLLEALPSLPDCSVDSIVTDGPYGLGKEPDALAMLRDWLTTGYHEVKGSGFMGKKWDAFVPQPIQWKECLRVLKPGGHLLAFAGTRTQDLMALGLRIAGFEIRDLIAWVYGSGFPKSLDVSKAIDGARTEDDAPSRAVGDWLRARREAAGFNQKEIAVHWPSVTGGLTGCVANWEGGKVPKWEQWLQLKALIGFGDEMDTEVWRLNGRKGEPGDTWKNAEIIGEYEGVPGGLGGERFTVRDKSIRAASEAAKTWEGWGTALKPALEPITLARKPLIGTVAGNVLAHGTGGMNIDGCRVECPDGLTKGGSCVGESALPMNKVNGQAEARERSREHPAGRWPANLIHDGSPEVVGLFPNAGANSTGKGGRAAQPYDHDNQIFGKGIADNHTPFDYQDSGSAARFFYTAKASKEDRDEGLASLSWTSAGDMTGGRAEGSAGLANPRAGAGRTGGGKNIHPTVKPTALMQYLCRLITPPGGVVLDPFMGSGSTGKAALLEGFRFIGVEREADYLPIAQGRILSARRSSIAVRHVNLQESLL